MFRQTALAVRSGTVREVVLPSLTMKSCRSAFLLSAVGGRTNRIEQVTVNIEEPAGSIWVRVCFRVRDEGPADVPEPSWNSTTGLPVISCAKNAGGPRPHARPT